MLQKIIMFGAWLFATAVQGQSWNMLGGGNSRNNHSPQYGLDEVQTPVWVVNDAAFTGFGGNIYTFGDRFAATRWNLNAGYSIIECRDLNSGELLWVSPDFGPTSKLHVTAFNEDAVYAHDYDESSMTYYALDPNNGQVRWSYPSYTFGPLDSPIFDCERNPIINTSLEVFNLDISVVRSVDKNTGETLWLLPEYVVILPNKLKTAYGDKLYMVTGSAIDPKKLMAADLNTGEILYYSDPIPGLSSQNSSPFIGHDGTIYIFRDGGDLLAYTDTGSGFSLQWQHTPDSLPIFQNPSVEADGNILFVDNGSIKRVSRADGSTLGLSAIDNLSTGTSILTTRDSAIHIANGEDAYMALSYDLQTVLWVAENTGNNTYAMPNLSYNGTMIMAGSGTTLRAYRNTQAYPPVADFYASQYTVFTGESVSFINASSYEPTEFQWAFEGGSPATSTDSNPAVVYDQPGTYRVELSVSNGLGSDMILKDCYIRVFPDTGLHVGNKPLHTRIIALPNPFHNSFRLQGEDLKPGSHYRIFNAVGMPVYEGVIQEVPFLFDAAALPASVYYMRFDQFPDICVKLIKN